MEQTNQTTVTYFILKGISDIPEHQPLSFFLFLLIYLFGLGGNIIIILFVILEPQLHTPMYFFLCNLSFLDICSITVTLHKPLLMFITGDNTVSYLTCVIQMYVFLCLASDELLILMSMSYDRYMAICNPLHYNMMISYRLCALMSFFCWVLGFLEVIPFLVLFLDISCFKSNIVNHFFCDLVPLLKLCCNDISLLEMLTITEGLFLVGLTPLILTFIPYGFIINAILRIRTATGRQKAFRTCSSHLTVVILLYVTLFCQYVRPTSMYSLHFKKYFSLFNTSAVPVLNPLIYSLKNKDVKLAIKRYLVFLKRNI